MPVNNLEVLFTAICVAPWKSPGHGFGHVRRD